MGNTAVFVRDKGTLGDHIVVYPLLHALHRHVVGSALRVVGSHDAGRFYSLLPWPVDYIRAPDLRSSVRALGRKAHAMIALPCSSERYGLIAALCRPPLRLGYSNNRLSDFAWTHSCIRNEDDYRALTYMYLLNTLVTVDIEANARECFERLAKTAVAPTARADVVLMPGGGLGAYKRWRLAHYLDLVALLEKDMGADTQFTFVLGPDEREEHAHLQQLAKPNIRLMMSRPLSEIADVCLSTRLVVANDCGPSHIAQNACVPYVCVLAFPNPSWYWERPYCRAVTPSNGIADIQQISAARVLAACREVMACDPRAARGWIGPAAKLDTVPASSALI
jgi:ADP-heptose:LPS heptosyltransferase